MMERYEKCDTVESIFTLRTSSRSNIAAPLSVSPIRCNTNFQDASVGTEVRVEIDPVDFITAQSTSTPIRNVNNNPHTVQESRSTIDFKNNLNSTERNEEEHKVNSSLNILLPTSQLHTLGT